MKYIIIGGVVLIMSLLVSKVFLALNLVHFNKYNTTLASSSESLNKRTKDDRLITMGRSIYMVYCSSCHGKDGKGNNDKAQDHTKRIAQKSVLDIINNGSNNFISVYPSGMPAALIDKKDAKEVAAYVAGGLKGEKPKAWGVCASCHDDSGEGIAYIAPNIKNYSDDLLQTVLMNGKKGVIGTMPSFEGRLSELQIRSIASYIRSIQR